MTTDWRKAREDLEGIEAMEVLPTELDQKAIMVAADAYALALAEWALAEVAMWVIDDAALDGVRNKLAAQVEAEHD